MADNLSPRSERESKRTPTGDPMRGAPIRDAGDATQASAMSGSLLQSLRDRALDESEPLAGLLRKCLLLGAETGSSSLRDWARLDLNGYTDEASVPAYRNCQASQFRWIRLVGTGGRRVKRLRDGSCRPPLGSSCPSFCT
ncbi:hypothetical protein [Microbacterium sp. P26]|uniref:AbiTii domain-containing protein n=1 Tax=Microbacterium TaxID=33882 RepID=UPI0034D71ADF